MQMQTSNFVSKGLTCAGDFLTPEGAENPPVIVMAHGFAATRNMALPRFAQRFVEAGYAVYLFDYRNFGGSEGEPRHWVDPARHLQDWQAALQHVRGLPGIDTQRIVLWGSSFSGGHVLATAARNPDISAVICQVPHVDGMATLRAMPISGVLRMTAAGIRDVLGSLVGHPGYSPVVGHPGELAAMTSPESYDGYLSLLPEGSDWENKVLSRAFLKIALYSPGYKAAKIQVPTLVVIGKNDSITPPDAARQVARKLPRGELVEFDCSHFEPYDGPVFEQNITAQLNFLKRNVPV